MTKTDALRSIKPVRAAGLGPLSIVSLEFFA